MSYMFCVYSLEEKTAIVSKVVCKQKRNKLSGLQFLLKAKKEPNTLKVYKSAQCLKKFCMPLRSAVKSFTFGNSQG